MNERIFSLETQEGEGFNVCGLFQSELNVLNIPENMNVPEAYIRMLYREIAENEKRELPVRISLPHRASFTLTRLGSIIALDCDLGWFPSDDIRLCEIDISEKDYPSAIRMNPGFMSIARSFENDFHVNKFVNLYNRYCDDDFLRVSTKLLGDEWLSQVYIHLKDPYKEMTNIKFSVLRSKYMENFDGNPELLDEPAMTLVGSIKLRGQHAHYFLFVTWWGDSAWRYRKNFFFNNTRFPK